MRHLDRANLRYPNLWKGCVGAWAPLLGPSGSVLHDWSGRNNHGTLSGISASSGWTPSGGQYAIITTGSPQHVSFDANSIKSDNTSYTVSLWARHSFPSNAGGTMSSDRASADSSIMWQLDCNTNQPRMLVRNASGSVLLVAGSSVNIVADVWYHFCGIRKNNTAEIYLNGVLTGADTGTVGTITNGQQKLAYTNTGSSINYFEGYIDDVMLHSRALTEREIRLLASRRGIAYETKRRTRYKAAGATGIGGSLLRSNLINAPLVSGRLVR